MMKSLVSILRQKLFKTPPEVPPESPPKVTPELTRETTPEPPATDKQAASAAPAAPQADNKAAPQSPVADVMAFAHKDPQAQVVVVPFGHICPAAVSVSPTSAYTVFTMQGCNDTQRNIAALADNVEGLRRISLTLQTAAQLLVIGHTTLDKHHTQKCNTNLFFDLLSRVRGNRADHIPMHLSEAQRLLMLAVESVSTAAAKGGEA